VIYGTRISACWSRVAPAARDWRPSSRFNAFGLESPGTGRGSVDEAVIKFHHQTFALVIPDLFTAAWIIWSVPPGPFGMCDVVARLGFTSWADPAPGDRKQHRR